MSVEGNQNAAKNKPWREALNRALCRYEGGKENALNLIADKVVTAAVSGDQWAINEIGQRLDGKAAQAVTVSGDSENPLRTVSRVELVALGG